MGGCRCSYKNCARTTKNSEKNFHFFHFPFRDEIRCLKWIENSKRLDFIHLPKDQLRNKVVCQLHFETACFTNANQNRLIHSAVPTLDAGSELEPEKDVLEVVQSAENVFTVDTSLLQNKIQDVPSYVIQNGNLVRAELAPVKEVLCETPIQDVDPLEVTIADVPSLPKESSSREREVFKTTEFVDVDNPQKITVEDLSKTIQSHSREIARLKRIMYRRVAKSSKGRILNSLRGVIPASLHAALSLHLYKKTNNFTKDERRFLKTIYTCSPLVYQKLKDDKWCLPDTNTLKNSVL